MAGVLPKTAYLLIENETVIGEFESLHLIAFNIGISVDDGQITFDGEKVSPTYSDEWNKAEIIKDWARYHMKRNMQNKYKVYRYLTGGSYGSY
jgi:hypothetical protein